MSFLRWLASAITAPDGSISSTRVAALGLVAVACYVAIRDGSHWQMVSALIGGGAVSLLLRVKGPVQPARDDLELDEDERDE